MIKIENANAEVEAAMEILGTDPPLSRTFRQSLGLFRETFINVGVNSA